MVVVLTKYISCYRFLIHNRIPGILGLVDCTVVKIVRPSVNEEAFFNHEHRHSLNVQIVCGENLCIYDVRICPGSNNDRNIWKYSDAQHYMRSLRQNDDIIRDEGHYYILGDSGYTPSPILLTPIRETQAGSPESLYTNEHCRTRSIVERLFGDENNTYLCVNRKRVLHYKPRKATKIILSCAVLHNFKLLNGIRQEENRGRRNERPNINAVEGDDYEAGMITRNVLINNYYRN